MRIALLMLLALICAHPAHAEDDPTEILWLDEWSATYEGRRKTGWAHERIVERLGSSL